MYRPPRRRPHRGPIHGAPADSLGVLMKTAPVGSVRRPRARCGLEPGVAFVAA
jgi:hypothetical protein